MNWLLNKRDLKGFFYPAFFLPAEEPCDTMVQSLYCTQNCAHDLELSLWFTQPSFLLSQVSKMSTQLFIKHANLVEGVMHSPDSLFSSLFFSPACVLIFLL